MAFSTLRLNSFDTSYTGDELRGNENDTEFEGELPGVRRRVGGDGTFTGWNEEIWWQLNYSQIWLNIPCNM